MQNEDLIALKLHILGLKDKKAKGTKRTPLVMSETLKMLAQEYLSTQHLNRGALTDRNSITFIVRLSSSDLV